jgi:hypothetical protein
MSVAERDILNSVKHCSLIAHNIPCFVVRVKKIHNNDLVPNINSVPRNSATLNNFLILTYTKVVSNKIYSV